MATMNLRTKGGSTPTPFKKSGQKAAEAIDVVVTLNGCDDAAVAALVARAFLGDSLENGGGRS